MTVAAVGFGIVAASLGIIGAAPAATGSGLQEPPAAGQLHDGIANRSPATPTATQSLAATGRLPSPDTSIRLDLPLGISRPRHDAIRPTPVGTRTKAQVARTVPRPVAAFLGDSYTTGWVGAGIGRAGWPSIVARTFGWKPKMRAVAGTGFVNPGWTGQPMRTQVAAIVKLRPGIVFIAGGHNDRRFATRRSIDAADAVLERLRRGLPDATLVVIGPIWQDGRPAASILALRDHLRRKARSIGALFIDPIRAGWFAGRAHRYIGADGIHPTNAGHRHVAAMILADLRDDRRFADRP